MSHTTAHPLGFTLGQVAEHFGVRTWQVVKLFERGLLPAGFATRIGILRIVRPEQMAQVEQALRAGGYLAATQE
jgi:hypothetical protein